MQKGSTRFLKFIGNHPAIFLTLLAAMLFYFGMVYKSEYWFTLCPNTILLPNFTNVEIMVAGFSTVIPLLIVYPICLLIFGFSYKITGKFIKSEDSYFEEGIIIIIIAVIVCLVANAWWVPGRAKESATYKIKELKERNMPLNCPSI
ncbi:MAG: hypothetical protein K0R98_740 [Rickettsiaceae bacterium]|nr:hypothetical protein [Rickettsiaceae bacterium]